MHAGRLILVLLVAVLVSVAEGGATSTDDEPERTLPPEVERPDFMRNKPFIPDALLIDKREGTYMTGIPAIGWDQEEGFNIGAIVEFYDNGSRDDPFFRTAPYRRKIFLGGVVTSASTFRVFARLDLPYIADSPYRLRVDGLLESNRQVHYFGVGDEGSDLISPGTGIGYTEFDDYQDDLDTRYAGGASTPTGAACPASEKSCSFSRHYQYAAEDIYFVASVERDLMGGLLRPLLGLQVRYIDIDDYTGERQETPSGGRKATQLETRLARDCRLGIVEGCDGGFDNFVKLGLAYDSRDFEPNPGRGVLVEGVAELSSRAFGSKRSYQRVTFSGSGFYDLLRERDTRQNLILAGRALYSMQFGTVPVFALPQLAFSDHDRFGLGGYATLRGYKRRRFVGESTVALAGEVRWFFSDWRVFGQDLRPGFAAFVDTGRAFDGVELDFDDWQTGYGGGFRLAWNLATIISFDVGVSREDAIFFMELGTAF